MYIPSNKIITNLYTNGDEYEIATTKVTYTGFYWKKYDGEIFTGKTPNSPNQRKLALRSEFKDPYQTSTNISTLQFDDVYSPLTSKYLNIKKIIPTLQNLKVPSQTYPKPTEDDYSLGVFTRYFTVKHNQSTYLEIDKDTFNSLNAQKTDWNWQPYLPFSIPWTLTGEEKVVEQTNKNIISLQEKRIKKLGLREFLRFNYLKFYQTNLES